MLHAPLGVDSLGNPEIVVAGFESAAAAADRGIHKLRKLMKRSGIENKADIRIAVFQLVRSVSLRYHASADAYHDIGIGILYMLVLSDYGECLFSLRARALRRYSRGSALPFSGSSQTVYPHFAAQSRHAFAVRLILLASEGADVAVLFLRRSAFFTSSHTESSYAISASDTVLDLLDYCQF